ncbi:hypothetical protein FGO68_gene9734 [Halteria grandinella]|uniref:Uncharacterized protein n=1 Tax=Halteria grandinella TaxID=5974 RepID=A0A8J8P880_HALGN|nr:hypothetical protein FGO68_gene9734 [Halteria grandinella]
MLIQKIRSSSLHEKILISQFAPLSVSCLINLIDLKFNDLTEGVSTVLTIAIIIWIHIALICSLFVKKDEDNYSSLFSKSWVKAKWDYLVCARWSITNLILVLLRDSCIMQIYTLLIISILTQFIISRTQPTEPTSSNEALMFNEVMVSTYLLTLISLTDTYDLSPDQREQIGLFQLGIIALNVSFNLLRFLRGVISNLYGKLQHLGKKCKKQDTVQIKPQSKTQSIIVSKSITNISIAPNTQEQNSADMFYDAFHINDAKSVGGEYIYGRTTVNF